VAGYDASGLAFEVGGGDIDRIHRLCYALDRLQSRWSRQEVGHRQRWRMRKAGARIRRRVKNLVRDLHCRLAKALCETYHAVLFPAFKTSGMVVQRGHRRISSKTVRALATWSHSAFKQRLLDKAREYPWCRVVAIVDEAYTSTGPAAGAGRSTAHSAGRCFDARPAT
jgi:putative transposase